MKLKVFSTRREIREFIKHSKDGFLPKLLTIEEFIDRAVLTEKNFLPRELIPLYLFRAAERVDLKKLGINSSFESFLEEYRLIYSFFKELFLERVKMDRLIELDPYERFREHIEILSALYEEYKKILQSEGFVDFVTLEEYEINRKYFQQFDEIEINLSGYLTRFDLEIVEAIGGCTILFDVDRFNKDLVKKMFGKELDEGRYIYKDKKIENIENIDKTLFNNKIERAHFSSRIEQANYVFAKIMEFYDEGIEPQNIAVILPDEEFKYFLEIFDEKNNLNFAMGHSFKDSKLFILLDSLYKAVAKDDEVSRKRAGEHLERFERIHNFKELEEFIFSLAGEREKTLIAQPLFELGFILKELQPIEMLRVVLKRFEELSFDDVGGGKVSVLGVLESRGVRYDGVIVVDFNEGLVPKVGSEDMFLNTKLREAVNLPTIAQKEQLQKHYYYQLFKGAKRVAVSYVKNEESDISRFFYELSDKEDEKRDYGSILYQFGNISSPKNELLEFEIPKTLSPTSLEMLLKCPKRYYLNKKFKAPREDYFGTLIHSAIGGAKDAKDEREYFERIWKNLLKNKTKSEALQIYAKWYKKLKRFAYKDFACLDKDMVYEEQKSKKFGDFTLKARADRVVYAKEGPVVYDFKTNNTPNYLNHYKKDDTKLQAEFYSYIWDSDDVYFWDLNNVSLQKVDVSGALESISKALKRLEGVTRMSEDLGYCRFCPFKFGCRGEV